MNARTAEQIFTADRDPGFEEMAMQIFRLQSQHNPVYSRYLEILQVNTGQVSGPEAIPFLPVDFFKTHRVITGNRKAEIIFESSGTTGQERSRHYVADASLYRKSCGMGFAHFYGAPEDYCILALLPSYLERKDSSLVCMARHLTDQSKHPLSGFYLDDYKGLSERMGRLEQTGQKSLLIGVSFALLDLAERFAMPLRHTLVMETGGMKGRRREMTRKELHAILKNAFSLEVIHSEYGMTEMLSQAYARRDGVFHTPPWMKVLVRDPYDPLSTSYRGTSGGINIIDLANIHSCAFLATQDLGRITGGGGFEVLGRFDHSELRGCNLMIE